MAVAGVSLFGDWIRLKAQLRKLELDGQDTKRLNKRIAVYIRESALDRFDSQTTPEGEAWEPLAPATIEKRTKQSDTGGGSGGDVNILVDSSTLKGSLTLKALASGAAVGTNVKYAAIQQAGGKAGRGKKVEIPARPYLGISKVDSKEIKAIIEEFAEEMSL